MEPRISIISFGVTDFDRSLKFYRDGLGFSTSAKEGDPIAFFKTSGVCFAIYPREKLAEDISSGLSPQIGDFRGFTVAHNTKTKDEVGQILARAEEFGGKIVKPAADTFWGGYGGYFSDPDGFHWEVAYADSWQFNEDGSLVID